ncbi:MAG TPA: glycosyltransferase, partial [Patescibacteria group bacterium]|nr:glycosyltransferase [Patescibacteria group bacterium]
LLSALGLAKDLEITKVTNTHIGPIRYIETITKLIWVRLTVRPQVYILGFRGHDIFLPVRLITLGKPLIFDEFINIYDWVVLEHKKFPQDSFIAKTVKFYSRLCLQTSTRIITDTNLNADFSSSLHGIPREKYFTIYVGTDEETFRSEPESRSIDKELSVFFYGTMLPLHGVNIILKTIKSLAHTSIKFVIIGGKDNKKVPEQISTFISKHHIQNLLYKPWVDYKYLPEYINKADICLAGPFGGTSQAKKVITGKAFQFISMGKPTVIGSINEAAGFQDKYNAIVIKQNSSKALSDAILWADSHREKLQNIGNRGRQLFEARFSNQIICKKLQRLIKETLV